MKRILIALVFSLLSVFEAFSKTGSGHRADILDVMFNSSKTETTKELADYISQGIDMGSGAKPSELAGKGSSYLNTMKQNYKEIFDQKLPGLGPHRTLGHWSLDGSIPGDYLKTLDDMERAGKLPPGSRQLFIDNWKEFVHTRTEAVKHVYNLSGPNSDRAARSFASMIGDIHNMGDWTTTDCRGLRPLEQVTDDFCRSGNRLLGKNNNLVKALKADLKPVFAKRNNMEVMKAFRKLPQGLTDAQKAEKILEFAKSMPDKEFNEWMMKNLKGLKGEARIKAIMEMPKRFADHKIAGEVLDVVKRYSDDLVGRTGRIFQRMGYDGVMRRINWEKLKATTKAWKTAKGIGDSMKSGVVAGKAYVRQVVSAGKKINIVEIPVSVDNGKIITSADNVVMTVGKQGVKQGAKSGVVKGAGKITEFLKSSAGQGVTAGVLSFALKEGETIVAYSQGKIATDEFNRRTALNAGVAAAEGCTVYLIAGATAGAPVAVTIGAFIVAGIVVEKAGEYVWYRIDREVGTFSGIDVDELFFSVDESVKKRRTMLDDLEALDKGVPNRAPIPYSDL